VWEWGSEGMQGVGESTGGTGLAPRLGQTRGTRCGCGDGVEEDGGVMICGRGERGTWGFLCGRGRGRLFWGRAG
jgi:hypothetical protein